MHKEILTKEQVELLPIVKKFSPDFFMVGGTAVALYLGHRRSVDFDLFSLKGFQNTNIRSKINRIRGVDQIFVNKKGEFTIILHSVKMTFFHYPFVVSADESFNDIIKMPTLLDLAAMKAHALGQRSKWKDYVDLRFILKERGSVAEIVVRAKHLFGNEFNEKIFRVQLGYFDDVNYAEEVEYMPGHEIEDERVKKDLEKFSLE